MKLTKKAVSSMQAKAVAEREKARCVYERQDGVVGLCEYILKNYELESETEGGSDGSSNGSNVKPGE